MIDMAGFLINQRVAGTRYCNGHDIQRETFAHLLSRSLARRK